MTNPRNRLWNASRATLLVLAIVVGLTAADVATGPGIAAAVDSTKGTPGYCPDADGVTVVIDFQELGGTTMIRCAPGDQATGHAALKNAGFEITGTNRWGEAFICRIEGKPDAAAEPCIDTPPASAYWSYWHAPNGGSWQYSQWGAMNRKPPPGSFEGWSFSKDNNQTTNPPPDITPVRPAAPAESGPADQPGETDTGHSDTGTGTGTGPTSGPDRTDEPADPAKTSDEPTAADEPIPDTDALPVEAEGWTGIGDDGMRSASTTEERGVPLSTAVGIGAVALLVIAGGVAAWRRRPALDDEHS